VKKETILKEQKLPQIQNAILAHYDIEQSEPGVLQQTVDDANAETKLRRLRTICLCDCAIPE
jgi:hypothetical protein